MKNLHKKISIGLLAALLVAGGSLLQGEKAFADSFEESYELADNSDALVVDNSNIEDVKEREKAKDLPLLQEWQEEFRYSVEECNEDVNISSEYDSVFDFSSDIEGNRENLSGQKNVKIGMNVYKIVFNN